MKHRIVTLLLLLLAFGGLAYAQEETDATDLNFIQLEDGEAVSGVFEDVVNAQLYMFLGSAGDEVTIEMVQAEESLLDPFLVLIGSRGQVYAEDDDSGDVPLSALIDGFELPEDGLYFVLATSFNGLRRGAVDDEEGMEPEFYELTVSGINTPDDLEDAESYAYFSGRMAPGDANVLELTVEEPIFFVTFSASDDEAVTITTSDDGDGDPVDTLLYLFNPFGERIAVNDDAGDGTLFSQIETLTEEEGIYMVFATAYQYQAATGDEWPSAGSFVLEID